MAAIDNSVAEHDRIQELEKTVVGLTILLRLHLNDGQWDAIKCLIPCDIKDIETTWQLLKSK